MGLHDTFRTNTPVTCPLDGAPVAEWRDSDGGTMLTWLQGRLTPVEADNPDPDAMFGSDGTERLPPFFGLRASHADHDLSALGRTDAADVWTEFELVEARASVLVPGAFWPPFREGESPTPRYEGIRLWREGALLSDGVARLEAERARLRSLLPAYGGDATCRLWQHSSDFGGEAPEPAAAIILGYPGFICERHLAEHQDPQAIVLW